MGDRAYYKQAVRSFNTLIIRGKEERVVSLRTSKTFQGVVVSTLLGLREASDEYCEKHGVAPNIQLVCRKCGTWMLPADRADPRVLACGEFRCLNCVVKFLAARRAQFGFPEPITRGNVRKLLETCSLQENLLKLPCRFCPSCK